MLKYDLTKMSLIQLNASICHFMESNAYSIFHQDWNPMWLKHVSVTPRQRLREPFILGMLQEGGTYAVTAT